MLFEKIKRAFDKNRKHFRDDGKLKRMYPLFEALGSFLLYS